MGLEQWGIVEVMGHVRVAGRVTEEVIAGATMLRVDVPETEHVAAFTRFYGMGAIYSFTPTDEPTARRAAGYFQAAPVSPYILLAEKVTLSFASGDEDDPGDIDPYPPNFDPDEDDDDLADDDPDEDYEDEDTDDLKEMEF